MHIPFRIIFKRHFDENRCIYFLIKKEKVLIKYMEDLEKFKESIKNKFNSEVIYSKKVSKSWKRHKYTQKEAFNVYMHQ